MGVYVSLAILPDPMESNEWLEAYEESLTFLKAWPEESMGLLVRKKGDQKRKLLSRNLEQNEDDPDKRHWHVVGDFTSKESGESFLLYANLDHYRKTVKSDRKTSKRGDGILTSLIRDTSDPAYVFEAKTQGYPYHSAMLAVGMLIEDRFPEYAHVSGDIDIHQAMDAREEIEDVLGKTVRLPLCVDAERLLESLLVLEKGKAVIGQFRDIYRGDLNETYQLLHTRCPDELTAWFMDALRDYSSPTQLGCIDLMMGWLMGTGNLDWLCEAACLREDGPRFDRVKFAEGLASTWISVDVASLQAVQAFNRPEGASDTVATQLGSALLDMQGLKGRRMNFHLPTETVTAVFARLFPDQCEEMARAFSDKTARTEKNLAEASPGMEALIERSSQECEPGDGSSFIVLHALDEASPRQKTILENFFRALASRCAEITAEKNEWVMGDRETLRENICQALVRRGPILTEDAWAWLDTEMDEDFLRLIVLLVTINNNTAFFCNLRRGLLENNAVFRACYLLTKDPEFMAKDGGS